VGAGVLTASLVFFKAGVVVVVSAVVGLVTGAGLSKEAADMGVGRDDICVRLGLLELELELELGGGGPVFDFDFAVAVAAIATAFLGGGPPWGGGGRAGGADLARASRAAKEASKRRATLAEGGTTCGALADGEAGGGRGGAWVVRPMETALEFEFGFDFKEEGEGGAMVVCVGFGGAVWVGGALVAVAVVVDVVLSSRAGLKADPLALALTLAPTMIGGWLELEEDLGGRLDLSTVGKISLALARERVDLTGTTGGIVGGAALLPPPPPPPPRVLLAWAIQSSVLDPFEEEGGATALVALALALRCPVNRRSSARRLAMASSADACKSRGGPVLPLLLLLVTLVAVGGRLVVVLVVVAVVAEPPLKAAAGRLLLLLPLPLLPMLVGVDPPRCFLMGCVRRGDMKLASGLFMLFV
jgi:hypothetical protein